MSERLFVGASKTTITPEVGGNLMGYNPTTYSERVNDDLTATAYVFRQGETKALLVTVSLCVIGFDVNERIVTMLSEKFDIPKYNIILCATHTHSGPITKFQAGWGDCDYKYIDGIMIPGILKACEEAVGSMVPVKVGIGQGDSLVGCNRRELRADNTIALGQNPWAPLNKKMTVISFKNEEGTVIANIIHYGCHGTAAGNNKEVSRDWPGVMEDVLTRDTGAVSAFINGPQGDVGPRCTNGRTTGIGNINFALELGGYAARDAKTIFDSIRAYHDADLSVFGGFVAVPLDKRIPKAEAEEQLAPIKDKFINHEGGRRAYLEEVLESYENGYEDLAERQVQQTIIRIGDVAIVSFPFEMFTEIGMRIDTYCTDIPYVLSLSNANGSGNYFVTEDQICRGGYEVKMYSQAYVQPYAKGADFALVCNTLENLKKV
ncbi:MAG: neutral/alkaline non-lysosomal ceramidase N-terminal domain-containing protein [Clostridia bacterium]|nr:neutral/alkaline non-lysosomal ceramidase N-terminal domain-containing protein [Clostridia bacterium]